MNTTGREEGGECGNKGSVGEPGEWPCCGCWKEQKWGVLSEPSQPEMINQMGGGTGK